MRSILLAAVLAISPSNRPTPVPGQVNGRMDPVQLVTVTPRCQVYRQAAPSMALLLRLAHANGVALNPTECYRPLSGQVSAQAKWTAAGNSACAARVVTSSTGQPVGTSMHGWGKAIDWNEAGRGLTFASGGYRWLKANAGRVGWNHPGWAEPGGSSCPEPWHWEWVGDGGTAGAAPIRADVVGVLPAANGYAVVTALGGVEPHGDFNNHGDAAGLNVSQLVVGAVTAGDNGYWLDAADGGVFAFGSARFHGSMGGIPLAQPIVGMAATPDGGGYWLVAADGGVFSFGAPFFGSTGGSPPASPVVGIASSTTGGGYWITAADGTVYPFGDAWR